MSTLSPAAVLPRMLAINRSAGSFPHSTPMKTTLIALAALAAAAHADPITFRSGPEHTPLLELFTSEGCSSCPPAEAWVNRLRQRGDLWKAFVPVVFHVDYWNGLGWPDRFSSAAFTQRQRAYATAWGTGTIYTPGFVLDGAEWRAWSGAGSVPTGARRVVGPLVLMMRDPATVEVSFSPAEKAPSPMQVEVALLGTSLETKVRAGENGGRTLRHEFVVLHQQTVALIHEGGVCRATFALPASARGAATAIAAWVNRGVGQPALQATGGWLPDR